MKSIWIANYENNEIKVENTWFNGERLYVNNILQDKTFGGFSTKLTGHLINRKNERENIKVNLGARFCKVNCLLFINDKKVEVRKEK
jgi:hypothetical protein